MEQRNKVGGIMDRRFGENDPSMTPEEKAAERYARESQKKLRKESMFNLEDDEEEEMQLTHKGQTLALDGNMNGDDFQEEEEEGEGDMSDGDGETPHKRKRTFVDDDYGQEVMGDEVHPERKKSKHEVMKEVIAKSKFHKIERQKTKEGDEDVREELDQELPSLFSLLRGTQPPPAREPTKDTGKEERSVDVGKEYDERLRQMVFDKRSQPTERTKTEEEKAAIEAEKLKTLEEQRLKRMRGEEVKDDDDSEEEEEDESENGSSSEGEESVPDDAKAFGLQSAPIPRQTSRPDLGVEDEDDFIIDDDLVETRSDVSLEFDDSEERDDDDAASAEESDNSDDGDEDLIAGLTLPSGDLKNGPDTSNDKLAFTYPCPEDHDSFLKVADDVPIQELPTVIQRIRALCHPRLHQDNKAKLGRFAAVLVEHVAYMANQTERTPPFAIIENILRHIHSLAKTHPDTVSQAFRAQLRQISTERPLDLVPGDLVIFTGITAIFPTSDHFHAVVTPAHLCLARYLEQGPVNSLADFVKGAYASSLCLQYQAMSKRFIPEVINYILNALCNLGPIGMTKNVTGYNFPLRKPKEPLHVQSLSKTDSHLGKLRFWDVLETEMDKAKTENLKHRLITTFIDLLDSAADLWMDKPAYAEIFSPAKKILLDLQNNKTKTTLNKLNKQITHSNLIRRPLLLHNHRPLAIKTSIPKFEESFNPDRHYDPNRERAEANKLKAEYKRERKGAMRELRKDANFVAREQLREKREREAAYHAKQRRLVAEIQNEEGREANAYEKEKRFLQGRA